MTNSNGKAWAYIKFNDDFIFVETYSGYFNCLPDPDGKRIFLSHASSDDELGTAVVEALAASRTIDPKKNSEFFDIRGRVTVHYERWINNAMSRFGYANKRALFKDMKNCSMDSVNGLITIRPTHHEKLEA